MIRSMTAFGRAVRSDDTYTVSVEMRSVNNRYLDCSVRLPRYFSGLEDRVRPYLQARGISRGKVDVNVCLESASPAARQRPIDPQALKAYLDMLYSLRDDYGLADDISVMRVAANSAIFVQDSAAEPVDDDERWALLESVLGEAVTAFIAAREREGERLREDLCLKLSHLRELSDEIDELSAADAQAYRARLEERLRTVLEDNRITVDENRLLTECAIHADKIAVDEELVRLRSHFSLFEELMRSDEAVGRKLDFLIQEMNREINTVGSKCSDADIAHRVVEAKNELEKIREQIQNLE